jgi:hypothetical protein
LREQRDDFLLLSGRRAGSQKQAKGKPHHGSA